MRKSYAALAAIGITLCLCVQASESVYSEQNKLIRGSRAITALGADLFGDRVSRYNGSLEFIQTDVSLPGNNALPVRVGRRLVAGGEFRTAGQFDD